MVATIYGVTTDPVCISDNATPASGTYAIYLHPNQMRRGWVANILPNGDQTTPAGIILKVLGGMGGDTITLEHHLHNVTTADATYSAGSTTVSRKQFLTAINAWNDGNVLLYLTINDQNSNNKALYLPFNTTTLAQIRCKLLGWQEIIDNSNVDDWTVTVVRCTA